LQAIINKPVVVDCLIVSETKIDSTFKDSLFEVDGYNLQRRDRTDSGGGIATFMRTDSLQLQLCLLLLAIIRKRNKYREDI